jgi:hypothetical protein
MRGTTSSRGAPISVGEDITALHRVQIPGAGGASARLDVNYESRDGEFIVNGIVELDSAVGRGMRSESAKASADLSIRIGAPTAAVVTVTSGCELFDKDVLALHNGLVDQGERCGFRMTRLAGFDEFTASLVFEAEARADNPPVPSTLNPKLKRTFTVRITEDIAFPQPK